MPKSNHPGSHGAAKGTANLTAPFVSWQALATVMNTYGVLPILDVQALTNASRFYRTQRLEP